SNESGTHIHRATLKDVSLISETAQAKPDLTPVTRDLATTVTTYDSNGQITDAELADGAHLRNSYGPADSSPLGRLNSTVTSDADGSAKPVSVQTVYHYEPSKVADTVVVEVGRQYGSNIAAEPPADAFRWSQSPSRAFRNVERIDQDSAVATKNVTHV